MSLVCIERWEENETAYSIVMEALFSIVIIWLMEFALSLLKKELPKLIVSAKALPDIIINIKANTALYLIYSPN